MTMKLWPPAPWFAMVVFAGVACSKASDPPPSGSSSGGQTSSSGSGGSRGGGSAGGSSSATGGSSASSGGSTGSGGSPGSGGSGSSNTGGSPAATGGSSGGDAGGDAPKDTTTTTEGGAADGGTGPAAALNGFLFDVACPSAAATGNCNVPIAMRAKMTTLKFGGDPNVTYKVNLHFCGPIEMRPYTGCTAMQAMYLCVDGVAATAGFNATYPTYGIKVANPPKTYFLNNRDLKDDLMKIDYSATIDVKGGSDITYLTDGGSNDGIYTSKLMNHNFMCPGVPNITQPFAGQFIYTTVESVTPAQ